MGLQMPTGRVGAPQTIQWGKYPIADRWLRGLFKYRENRGGLTFEGSVFRLDDMQPSLALGTGGAQAMNRKLGITLWI